MGACCFFGGNKGEDGWLAVGALPSTTDCIPKIVSSILRYSLALATELAEINNGVRA